MRHMQFFLSLTNDFSRITCQHSQKSLDKPYITSANIRKYVVLILQISVFGFAVYDLVIHILKAYFKDLLTTLFGLEFLFDYIVLEFLIKHCIQWNEGVLAEMEELLWVSERVKSFSKYESYFKKWYFLPYYVLVPQMMVFFSNEVIFTLYHGMNTIGLARAFIRIIIGK